MAPRDNSGRALTSVRPKLEQIGRGGAWTMISINGPNYLGLSFKIARAQAPGLGSSSTTMGPGMRWRSRVVLPVALPLH